MLHLLRNLALESGGRENEEPPSLVLEMDGSNWFGPVAVSLRRPRPACVTDWLFQAFSSQRAETPRPGNFLSRREARRRRKGARFGHEVRAAATRDRAGRAWLA